MQPDTIPTLSTVRLVLSPLMVADAADMVEIYADQAMHTYTGGAPRTAEELRERFERLTVGWNHDRSEQWCNWIVRCQEQSSPVGAMQATIATDLEWAAVAWEVGVAHQGKGFASESAVAVVDWLIASGVRRIVASIHPDHIASAKVAARVGLMPTNELDDGEVVWQRAVRARTEKRSDGRRES